MENLFILINSVKKLFQETMPASVVWKPTDIGKIGLYTVSHFIKREFLICQRASLCSVFAIQVR